MHGYILAHVMYKKESAFVYHQYIMPMKDSRSQTSRNNDLLRARQEVPCGQRKYLDQVDVFIQVDTLVNTSHAFW